MRGATTSNDEPHKPAGRSTGGGVAASTQDTDEQDTGEAVDWRRPTPEQGAEKVPAGLVWHNPGFVPKTRRPMSTRALDEDLERHLDAVAPDDGLTDNDAGGASGQADGSEGDDGILD